MATHPHLQDFADTVPAPYAPTHTAARRPRGGADGDDALLTPYRLVALVGWVVAVTLLLASIAGVAQSQVARGQAFQYADAERSTTALAAVYSSRAGERARDQADAARVAALTAR